MYDLNNIKQEKVVDFTVQLLCLVLPLGYSIFMQDLEYMFLAYFTVGGWQVLSCLFNLSRMKSSYIDSSRKMYNNLLLIVAVVVGVGFLLLLAGVGIIVVILLALLLLSPLMAIQYAIITYNEYNNVSKLLNA